MSSTSIKGDLVKKLLNNEKNTTAAAEKMNVSQDPRVAGPLKSMEDSDFDAESSSNLALAKPEQNNHKAAATFE